MSIERLGKVWPYPFYFGRILGHKEPVQGRHFPDEFRADLYEFGIRRARRMGTDKVIIKNHFFFISVYKAVYIIKVY